MSSVARVAGSAAGSTCGGMTKPEAVLPQRVAGNQDAMLGVVEDERAHVVARRGERAPFQIAPDVRRARRKTSSTLKRSPTGPQ